jgi:hypothetical protein
MSAVSVADRLLSHHKHQMITIDIDVLRQLPLARIDKVVFYKIDELTTDLLCCDVEIDGKVCTFHEEMPGWKELLRHLGHLPGFRADWFASVAQPPFETCETVAFTRR